MIPFWQDGVLYTLENFELYEVRCRGDNGHDCGLMILDPELLYLLGRVRIRYDMPVVVTSWTRCWLHNGEVGGSDTSKHPLGRAVDLKAMPVARGGDMTLLRRICKQVFPYIKDYVGHIHCDVR